MILNSSKRTNVNNSTKMIHHLLLREGYNLKIWNFRRKVRKRFSFITWYSTLKLQEIYLVTQMNQNCYLGCVYHFMPRVGRSKYQEPSDWYFPVNCSEKTLTLLLRSHGSQSQTETTSMTNHLWWRNKQSLVQDLQWFSWDISEKQDKYIAAPSSSLSSKASKQYGHVLILKFPVIFNRPLLKYNNFGDYISYNLQYGK